MLGDEPPLSAGDTKHMAKTLYIGNLPYTATEGELRELFEKHGSVESVHIVTDRDTGRSRGFGFIEMDEAGASEAVRNLDGTDFGGRNLRVDAARPRRGGGGGGGRRPRQ